MKGRDNRTNHSNQMNPNNDAYWQARGYNERPGNWEDQLANGPVPVKFTQDVAWGHPLEPDILDGQVGTDNLAHPAGQMLPVPFPEGEEEVEGEDLRTPEMGGVPVESHLIVPDRCLGQFPVFRVDPIGPVVPVPMH